MKNCFITVRAPVKSQLPDRKYLMFQTVLSVLFPLKYSEYLYIAVVSHYWLDRSGLLIYSQKIQQSK